jgi:sulfite reductase alpha subunit-like flavoprotein
MACAIRMRDVNGQRHNRSALILYGSESGISQDAAEQLGRILERLRFLTEVLEMDLIQPVCPPTNKASYGQYAYSYGLSELSMYTIVIFTISTTGQGDVPRNARKFWRSLLRKSLPTDYLSPVNFTTFGFGDSSYIKCVEMWLTAACFIH